MGDAEFEIWTGLSRLGSLEFENDPQKSDIREERRGAGSKVIVGRHL